MEYSSDESSEEDSSESEESISSKSGDDNENVDLEVEEFILPDTVEGIRDRFYALCGIREKGKTEMSWSFYWMSCYVRVLSALPNTRS